MQAYDIYIHLNVALSVKMNAHKVFWHTYTHALSHDANIWHGLQNITPLLLDYHLQAHILATDESLAPCLISHPFSSPTTTPLQERPLFT